MGSNSQKSDESTNTLKCPKCGSAFYCGSQRINSCFCAMIPLTPAQREKLASTYTGCLCPDCLRGASKPDD